MRRSRTYLIPFATTALLVAAADLGTKHLAESLLGTGEVQSLALGDLMRLVVVHNDGLAFGLSIGRLTWSLSIAMSVAAIVLIVAVCGELVRIDKAAPRALGLIAGAALGNLGSLLLSPAGVVDFLALGHGGGRELVLNLADVAAYVGLAMIVRTTWLAVRALRAEQQRKPAVARSATRAYELELPLSVSVEPSRSASSPLSRAEADVVTTVSPIASQPRAD